MVESTQALDTLRHEFAYKVHLSDYLRVPQAADDVNYYALKVVRVNKELLGRDVVALPKEVYFLADLARAAIVDPLKLAHG